MKKLISLFIALSILVIALVSCGQQAVPSESVTVPSESAPTESVPSSDLPTDEPSATGKSPSQSVAGSTEAPQESTTNSGTTEPHNIASSGYSLKKNDHSLNFVETPSKIIFLQLLAGSGAKSLVYYYSKADGEFYPFCFDPLCQHQDIWDGEKYVGTTCVAKMLYRYTYTRVDAYTPPIYCNGRIYFAYFDEIWSCNEYATDIRIDVSFSKMTENITQTEARKRFNSNEFIYFLSFASGGNSIYFRHQDADREFRYYRLDTETRKLHDLSKGMTDLAEKLGFKTFSFYYAVGNYIVFRGAKPGDSKVQIITTDQNLNITNIPFLGENDTILVVRNTANGQLCRIDRFDEEHNPLSYEYVEVLPDGECKQLDAGEKGIYVTDDYTYSYGGEAVELGYSTAMGGKSERVVNKCPDIVRYNKETGEKEVIFHDDWLRMDTIYYVNEETGEFLARVDRYEKDKDGYVYSRSSLIYKGKLIDGKLEDFQQSRIDDEGSIEPPFIIPGWD
ncbi:MAG: hypothetical protein IJQ37_00285 [Clostridia bacterium]|nr:hypothetical protein [Clostridia bacterium]